MGKAKNVLSPCETNILHLAFRIEGIDSDNMLFRFSLILGLALYVFAIPVYAEDTLATVMKNMQLESAVQIAYQETRYLELMQEPWQATGFMYALSPDILVKEQRTPVREIMGASGDEMFYYNPINDVRHRGVIEIDDALSLNVAAFKALITGDRQLLEKIYQIDFSSKREQWRLTLIGHWDNEVTVKIIVTGLAGQPANKIVVHQPDGDRSEFILAEAARGDYLKDTVQQLNRELLGD